VLRLFDHVNSRWWLDNAHVSILGKPSAKLAQDLAKNEIARIDIRKKQLGEEGLSKLKRKLEEAQEENDKPIPQDLIRKFKVPNINNIKFIQTVNAYYFPKSHPSALPRNEVEQYIDTDPSDNNPLHLVFSHTSTQFVTLAIYLTTHQLPGHLLPYLQLYLDSFFQLPIRRNGEIVNYEKVVAEVNQIAVDYSATLGVEDVTEVICIKIRGEISQYQALVQLLSELFVNSVFDPERYDFHRYS
jgi:Zn-dependent M16 (insulinase) family peptidase